LPKYYYKPIEKVVKDSYFENTGNELFKDEVYDLDIELIVTAEDEVASDKSRMCITDKDMWELFKTED
jgi:hypothetical protein